jgi:hypothetical protein
MSSPFIPNIAFHVCLLAHYTCRLQNRRYPLNQSYCGQPTLALLINHINSPLAYHASTMLSASARTFYAACFAVVLLLGRVQVSTRLG